MDEIDLLKSKLEKLQKERDYFGNRWRVCEKQRDDSRKSEQEIDAICTDLAKERDAALDAIIELKEEMAEDIGRRSLIQELQGLLTSRGFWAPKPTSNVKTDGADLISAVAAALDSLIDRK